MVYANFLKQIKDNLQLLLDNIKPQSVLGDFDVTFSNWHEHNKITYGGSKIDVVASQFGLQQLPKGCVCYAFPSLFFKSKWEHKLRKMLLFHFKSSFCSRENQILEF